MAEKVNQSKPIPAPRLSTNFKPAVPERSFRNSNSSINPHFPYNNTVFADYQLEVKQSFEGAPLVLHKSTRLSPVKSISSQTIPCSTSGHDLGSVNVVPTYDRSDAESQKENNQRSIISSNSNLSPLHSFLHSFADSQPHMDHFKSDLHIQESWARNLLPVQLSTENFLSKLSLPFAMTAASSSANNLYGNFYSSDIADSNKSDFLPEQSARFSMNLIELDDFKMVEEKNEKNENIHNISMEEKIFCSTREAVIENAEENSLAGLEIGPGGSIWNPGYIGLDEYRKMLHNSTCSNIADPKIR